MAWGYFFPVVWFDFFILELTFDFYETFVIEEEYGFNKSDTKTWLIE